MCNNLCFASVLFCVQYFVTDSTLGELTRQILALFDTDCSHQDWLALFVTFGDVVDDCLELGDFTLINKVGFIISNNIAVGGNRNNLQFVGVHQFSSFGLRSTSHTRQLVVHAEVVLQSNCCQRLVFFVNTKSFFGFYCLVNTFTPATAFKNTPCEFVDNLDFATIDDVILVASVELFGSKRYSQLVHKVLLNSVVQVVET
ncbi:unannotated protein [freshwater metagenome]|uniref:Unannotated protein n=1 Tax=freshwater metagenome TaxID=449393 RepID=A0A6J6I1W5_9ZZZZ